MPDVQLAHMVYFQLTESSQTNRDHLVGQCQKYLSGHDGTVYFSWARGFPIYSGMSTFKTLM